MEMEIYPRPETIQRYIKKAILIEHYYCLIKIDATMRKLICSIKNIDINNSLYCVM